MDNCSIVVKVESAVNLKQELETDYFVRVPWSPGPTEDAICRFAKCLGFPFPLGEVIPGMVIKILLP